jgi:hypothetical protein
MNTKMNNNYIHKAFVFSLILLLLFFPSIQAFNSSTNSLKKNYEKNNPLASISNDRDWHWKESFPNYAPRGVPDFFQQQNQWKSITDGGNGLSETNATGDDLQLIPYGEITNPGDIIIAPGQNCQLDTNVSGDDKANWAYSGPVAVANCLWWFDSKFGNPDGTPGDGEDGYLLVEDYGSGDDHLSTNTPLLIEELAKAMNTTDKGRTILNNMVGGINRWMSDINLSDNYKLNIRDKPTFTTIEQEINRSNDVILLLGFYDYIISEKIVDQSQPDIGYSKLLQTSSWWDYQSFIPTVDRLDAIRICIGSTSSDTCEVEINVYDTQQGDPLGTVSMDPGYLFTPTWIQFHFDQNVELTPNATYYFDVCQSESGYHYDWYYESYDPYPSGSGWMNQNPYDPYGIPFDWAFETEYYDPPPSSVRKDEHYVTCAGVNKQNTSIAFSDPIFDINNPTQNDHNDAQNVSHDRYKINSPSPLPDLDYNCWIPNYSTPYNYTVIEQAVVLSELPDTLPPTVEITKPRKAIYFLNEEVYPFFFPTIIGPIDIKVNVTDNREVDRVEFYINDEKQKTDRTAPYKWRWEEGVFFIQIVDIVAVDSFGNYGYDTLTVLKFF